MSGYNTNMASEFLVLSALHRQGLDANLTLGNKKAVDIVIVRDAGETITVDVKGLAGKTGWPVDNIKTARQNHFIVFVCFLDRIKDITAMPEIYVVPSMEVHYLFYKAPGGRRLVRLSKLRGSRAEYQNAWHLLGD